MKVAIASDDRKEISQHFGRALGFEIFEIQEDTIVDRSYRENIGKHNGDCGSCNHDVMINNLKDCNVVICFGMGHRIYHDLERHNIRPFITDEKMVDEAIKKYMHENLTNRVDRLH
jgi:predicted Fe-Mo cluster-binding NifX family protein